MFGNAFVLECHVETEHNEVTVLNDHRNDVINQKQSKPQKEEQINIDEIVNTKAMNEDDLVVVCGECNVFFNNISDCEIHMESHPSKCYLCEFQSENKQELSIHERKHLYRKCEPHSHEGKCKNIPVDQAQQVICDQCGKQYKDNIGLLNHKKKDHEGLLSFYCNECKVGFKDARELGEHSLIHSKPVPVSSSPARMKCDQCSFVGDTELLMESH